MWLVETQQQIHIARRSANPHVGPPDSVWRSLANLVEAAPKDRWLVDASGERLITSDGLAVIVSTVGKVQDAGGRLAFACCSPALVTVITTMRLQRMLNLYPDLHSGLVALGNP